MNVDWIVTACHSSHLSHWKVAESRLSAKTEMWVIFLYYARHSWLLSSEDSLTCHTHGDTGLPFIMVITEDPWQSHLLPSVWQWSCDYMYLFKGLGSVVTADRIPISRMRGELSTSRQPRLSTLLLKPLQAFIMEEHETASPVRLTPALYKQIEFTNKKIKKINISLHFTSKP